jgi:hypothetical protein
VTRVTAPQSAQLLSASFHKIVGQGPIWRYPLDSRPRLDAAIERHRGHLRVVELTSPRKVKEFLNDLG